MRRRPVRLILLTLATTACVGSSQPVETTPGEGRLVIVSNSGDVVTMGRDGSDRVAVTDDAGQDVVHFQPVWGRQGIAWAETGPSGTGLALADGDGGNRRLVTTDAPVFYQHWSPDGDQVATLHNSATPGSLDLEVVEVDSGRSRLAAQGSPLYFSWSPDGERIAAHIGRDDLVVVSTVGRTEDLGVTRAGYQAPVWLEEGVVHLGVSGLELLSEDGESSLLAEVEEPVLFTTSPGGERIAVQSFADTGGTEVGLATAPSLPRGRLSILEPASATVTSASSQLTAGFFWSPDGRSLLVLVPHDQALRVEVWSDGESRELAVVEPAPGLVERMLLFFDQYAQSLRLWSPDSTAVALPGTIQGESGIWVLPVDGSDPALVATGSWASWSLD